MVRSKRVLAFSAICSLSLLMSACSSSNNDTSTEDEDPLSLGGTDGGSEGGAGGSGLAPSAAATPVVGNSPVGRVLADAENGLTLYTATFEPDTVACDVTCEAIWPPLLTTFTTETAGSTGQFGIFARADGTQQWTLNGLLLYTYTGDAASGDASGEGVDDQFYVARPIPVTSAAGPDGEEVFVAYGSTFTAADAERTDKDGFTLYFFANDTAGASVCDGGCATNWPPLLADLGARGYDRYSLIERTDGSVQWAYDDKALYYYIGDNAVGEFNGDGVGGVWSIAQ